jgi:hypothetical protein
MKIQIKPSFTTIAFLCIFILMAWSYLFRSVAEPDFFWHLKTGEWIWQNLTLPSSDPFTFTSSDQPTPRQIFILQGYWLIQLVYNSCIAVFGLWGVFVLRLLLLGAFFLLFWRAFRNGHVSPWLATGLLLAFSIFYLENYALERPQVVTFLGVGMLLALYRGVRDKPEVFSTARTVFLSMLLMALWGNSHGGILVGQGVLAIVFSVETIRFALSRNADCYKRQLCFVVSAALGSCLVPNLISRELLSSLVGVQDQAMHVRNYEYFSIYKWLVVNQNYKLTLVVLVFFVAVFFARKAVKDRAYVEILVFLIVWFYAFKHVRYVPIALVLSLLFVAWYYYESLTVKVLSLIVLAAAVVSFGVWTVNDLDNYRAIRQRGFVNPQVMPVGAADFLEQSQASGRIFNTMNWGGYLIWRLYPQASFFIDSRYLDAALVEESKLILSQGGRNDRPGYWKDAMDRYEIDTIVLPLYSNRGRILALNQALANDPDWGMAYRDTLSVVFKRRNG